MNNHHFISDTDEFDLFNLAYLAYCSNLVYEPRNTIGLQLDALGFDTSAHSYFISNHETETQCFIAGDDDKIIIAFRGTEGKIADWSTDAKITKSTWTESRPIGEVHSGFYTSLSSIWPQLLDEIERLKTNGQSIWLTGHSLGGALAVLAAATLHFEDAPVDIRGVYTFGQPRLVDEAFAHQFNRHLKGKCFRVVNNNDIVTQIPLKLQGYSHVGTLKYFDRHGKLHSDDELVWWYRFMDQFNSSMGSLFQMVPDSISDHSMKHYLNLSRQKLPTT